MPGDIPGINDLPARLLGGAAGRLGIGPAHKNLDGILQLGLVLIDTSAWLATKADITHMLQILDKGWLNNEK